MAKYLYLILFFLVFFSRFDDATEVSPEDSSHSLTEISEAYSQISQSDDTETTIDDEDEVKILKPGVFVVVIQTLCNGSPKVQTNKYSFSERILHYSDSSPPTRVLA